MLSEMKYVYAVYQEQSFSKAAKKLYISQPALSAMVKKAETTIGCQIFDRTHIPLTVTPQGEYYIQEIQTILASVDNIHRYYQDVQQLEQGQLLIGGSSFFCAYVLSGAIASFKERHSGIQVELMEGNLSDLKTGLQEGTLDLIIETALQEKEDDLTCHLLGYEDIILCVPAHFPENEALSSYQMTFKQVQQQLFKDDNFPPVPLIKLSHVPFLLMKKGNDMYQRSMKICKNAGFTPACTMFLDQILTSFYISQRGSGAVFMRASLYQFLPPTDRMVYYKIGDPLARRPVFMASHGKRYLSYAANQFLSELKKQGLEGLF